MAVPNSIEACKKCGNPISQKRRRNGAKFCTQRCAEDMQRDSYRAANPKHGIVPGALGAISELIVATDLMRRGFEVFRPLSPCCPCDLAFLRKDGTLTRVEVRTGRDTPTGKVSLATLPKDSDRYELLAVVVADDWRIIYTPELEGALKL